MGLLVLAVYGLVTVGRRRPADATGSPAAVPVARWSVATVVLGTAGAALATAAVGLHDGLHAASFGAAERGLAVLIVGLVVAGGVWRVAAQRA